MASPGHSTRAFLASALPSILAYSRYTLRAPLPSPLFIVWTLSSPKLTKHSLPIAQPSRCLRCGVQNFPSRFAPLQRVLHVLRHSTQTPDPNRAPFHFIKTHVPHKAFSPTRSSSYHVKLILYIHRCTLTATADRRSSAPCLPMPAAEQRPRRTPLSMPLYGLSPDPLLNQPRLSASEIRVDTWFDSVDYSTIQDEFKYSAAAVGGILLYA
jgi:hypothetical protein